VLARRQGVPSYQLRAEIFGLDERVDHQLGSQVQDVDVPSVLGAQFLGPGGTFLGILDGLKLVVVDGVDRGLRSHDRDRGRGQRDAAIGIERRPGHGVQAGPVGLTDDDRQFRHGGLGHRADHLGAVPDDPLTLDLGTDHEPRHVGQEQQRDVERIAGRDEPGALVCGVHEQHPALDLGLVGHDSDHPPVQPGVAHDHLLGPARVDLQK
jgi:hypothetical protein